MKKTNRLILTIICLFVVLLSTTLFVSFSSNVDVQEVVVKSITPVYDSNSTIEVDRDNVVFNDKNQTVEYKVVIENTQNYDIKITDIALSTPTEKFLTYEVEGINEDDVLGANSTKELTISLETTGIKGWGRNFADELTANISFEKVVKEVTPPVEDKEDEGEPPKEEVKVPEKPAASTEELISKTEKIEIIKVTKDTIEFKETPKLETGDKIAVWLYSDPIFLGYFDVVVTNGIKQIVGLEEALKESDIESGEHHIVLATEENETIGYVSVYVSENKSLSSEPVDDNDGKVENPYTSTGWLVIYTTIAGIAVIGIVFLRNKKVNKYFILAILLSSSLSFVKAEKSIEIKIPINVSFKSQNVMKAAYIMNDEEKAEYQDYWVYREKIRNFYIKNEIEEITNYEHKFDVTEEQNNRVIAYLITNENNTDFYDVYLQADGIIYPNTDATAYFNKMMNLEMIDNLAGMDTSEVTNMTAMFQKTGYNSISFTLDLSDFDTSKVENMEYMFAYTGYNSSNFTLDLSNFDTSQVTNMNAMFQYAGYNNTNFTLDVSNFDTSNVVGMGYMFKQTGYNSKVLELDVSGFNTSKTTMMLGMFECAGYSNPTFTLDVSNFDTSNVTDMGYMFSQTGYNSKNLVLDVSDFDTSQAENMMAMFQCAGYSNPTFTLDVSNFNTDNVTNMAFMFSKAGNSSDIFTLDVSNFNTSKVTRMENMFTLVGASNSNFTLDVSNFDTSSATRMENMFLQAAGISNKFNITITISNPNITYYAAIFRDTALLSGAQIKVNYTSKTSSLVDKMIATKTEGANVVKGECVDCVNYDIGAEISIGEEKFNVISQTDETVTMLAQYNLGTDYKQSTTANKVNFSDDNGWEYTPGPKEIDIQEWSTNPKTYVNEYVEYLKTELEDDSVTGDLITLKELQTLGCTIQDNYLDNDDETCTNSLYKSWLISEQWWWTRSTSSENDFHVWFVFSGGNLNKGVYAAIICGIRPVITISKEALRNLN